MKSSDESASGPPSSESAAVPRKPWHTPVVILETIGNQTRVSNYTGTDAPASPFTHS